MIEDISKSEWRVLRVLWTLQEATSRQLTDVLQAQQKWEPSTTKTLLRRLMAKDLVVASGQTRNKTYRVTLREAALTTQRLTNVIAEICARQVGTALTDVIEHVPLSQGDIQQLQVLLADKAKTAPTNIACDCLPHACQCTSEQNCDHHGGN
jgi:CopY/TcrY family copper transport repressor